MSQEDLLELGHGATPETLTSMPEFLQAFLVHKYGLPSISEGHMYAIVESTQVCAHCVGTCRPRCASRRTGLCRVSAAVCGPVNAAAAVRHDGWCHRGRPLHAAARGYRHAPLPTGVPALHSIAAASQPVRVGALVLLWSRGGGAVPRCRRTAALLSPECGNGREEWDCDCDSDWE